jgi:beta-glucosidase
MMNLRIAIYAGALALAFQYTSASPDGDRPLYTNPAYDTETRAKDLLKRMTAEEKFGQLFICDGAWGNDSSLFRMGILGMQPRNIFDRQYPYGEYVRKLNDVQRFFIQNTRLGIPALFNEEALHGLVYRDAVAYPQSIALAATFDTSLMSSVAENIAAETEAYGIRQVFSPVLNLAGDPRWGRTEECYGEDPFLVSRMGVAFIRPFESRSIVTTPKHFIANYGEGGRDSYPIGWSERYLEQTHFPPFKAAIREAGARSIMAAYNSLDGRPCSANQKLLTDKLRNEWGFEGMVISDAGGTGGSLVLHRTASSYEDAGKQAVEAGLDAILQTDIRHFDLFKAPFLNGQTDQAAVDSAVMRVLRLKIGLGLFEKPYIVSSPDSLSSLRERSHRLAKEVAAASFVLLKNAGDNILPLNDSIRSLCVVGDDARTAVLGGYAGTGYRNTSILEGLQKQMRGRRKIEFVSGCGKGKEPFVTVPSGALHHIKIEKRDPKNLLEPVPMIYEVPGLEAKYFNAMDIKVDPVLERIDTAIDFKWTLYGPDPVVDREFFSVVWQGLITGPDTGTVRLGISGNDGYRMYIDGKVVIDTRKEQGYHTRTTDIDFSSRPTRLIRIEYYEPEGNSIFRLVWNVGVADSDEADIRNAVETARRSDAVVVVAGTREGEFMDRSSLALPGRQEEMLLRLAATGKPVVVLLQAGSAIRMDRWIDSVDAVMDIWYPGEAGGEAVAEVLDGSMYPSGKLPITFPVNEGQLPLTYYHEPTGRGDDYTDGTGRPLFPFGFGLSYSEFRFDSLVIDNPFPKESSLRYAFTVTNTGNRAAAETGQVYLTKKVSAAAWPLKKLAGFAKVRLRPGESKRIEGMITKEQLLNEDPESLIKGDYRLMVGASSRDIRLREEFSVR